MGTDKTNIFIGRVIDVKDPTGGERVKVHIDGMGIKDDYAFPLLPKYFRSKPKENEAVLVFSAEQGEANSQKYYIGPLIPQYNYLKSASYIIGTSVLDGGLGEEKPISDIPTSNGAFPIKDEVAIFGRGKTDIILDENTIDIRCGVRTTDDIAEHGKPLDKPIAFNNSNPSFIKLNYENGNSSINLVADEINLVSNNDSDKNGEYINTRNPNGSLSVEDIESFKDRLHEIPYGDVLCDFLEIVKNAIITHIHPYHGMPALQHGDIIQLENFIIDDIKSRHHKIS